MAVVVVAGCRMIGPEMRARRPTVIQDGEATISLAAINRLQFEGQMNVDADVVGPAPIGVTAARLAPASASPCTTGTPASTILVDDAVSWMRPLPAAGKHRLTFEFPAAHELNPTLAAAPVIDISISSDGQRCLRLPLSTGSPHFEWAPVDGPMLGFRLAGPSVALALRAGRWFGPVLAGLEVGAAVDRIPAALLAGVGLSENFVLEVAYAVWWDIEGERRARGSFRHGPRIGLGLVTPHGHGLLGGQKIGFSGLDVTAARWAGRGGEAPRYELGGGLLFWWSP
ncbi:MAG TPA: hypothetical protein VFH73_05960 [Polyangia bacterium]|nr:hypothetical protein [Polyangia bacterium]